MTSTTPIRRVNALYRVSTTKQVDINKDDIPMQRIACREFAQRNGWTITREFEEKGVSGFKVSAEDRDAIQELKDCALRKEFDILLVFMFDRLGRIENETPFVLQWFAEHNVEVWSVNEGQQRFENHVDKLMNYIRFWQASGESEKTSIRVKTRLQQMTSEGIYTGGGVPYGYHLIYNGRKNKKGAEMRDLAVEPTEAEVVRRVFRMTIEEGCGAFQVADTLNKEGIRTHKGAEFQSGLIKRLLTNELYRGFIVNGEVRSGRIEALQIISDAMYLQAQEILKSRSERSDAKRAVAMSNRSSALLSGNIFCMHCGCRLTTSRYRNAYVDDDGETRYYGYGRYVCYHRSRGLNDCDGASVYNAEKIDAAVMVVMRQIFDNIGGCPQEEQIQNAYKNMITENHRMQKTMSESLKKDKKQLEMLRTEIGKVLLGDSLYNSEDLQLAIQTIKERITETEEKLGLLKDEEVQKKLVSESILPAYQQFRSWAEEFEDAPFIVKKRIASQLFSRVEVGKGYRLRMEMNMTYRQFCEDWNGEGKISTIG